MNSGESIEIQQEIKLPQPRLKVQLPENRDISYTNLYKDFLRENGVEIATDSSDSSEESDKSYSYPAFMQRLIERLDKYGQLALRDSIGIHKNDPRKKRKIAEEEEKSENSKENSSSEDSCDLYYDLSDDFIDDTDINQANNEEVSEYKKSLSEGFFVVAKEEVEKIYAKKNTKVQQKTPKKTKEKIEPPKIEFQKKPETNIDHLDPAIKPIIEELKGIYETNRTKGNKTPFPKDSASLFGKILEKMKENLGADYDSLFNNLAQISGQTTEIVKGHIEKLRLKKEKNNTGAELKNKIKDLKKKIQPASAVWNNDLRKLLLETLSCLQENVEKSNTLLGNSKGKKAKNLMAYEEEEKKLIEDLKSANRRLQDVDLKAEIPVREEPVKSEEFNDKSVRFNQKDFQKIGD